MSYAIIALGGKQYRVREGQRLLVDRLALDEGATLTPDVLLVGGDGETRLSPDGAVVTARVVGHVLGEKIRIGKYKAKKGYRRHAGFRAKLSQIEIAEIGTASAAPRRRERTQQAAPAEAPAPSAVAPAPEPEPAAEPEPVATAETVEEPPDAGQVPPGYEGMTVAQVAQASGEWELDALRAALAHERAHAGRKGALAALEAAIAAKEDG